MIEIHLSDFSDSFFFMLSLVVITFVAALLFGIVKAGLWRPLHRNDGRFRKMEAILFWSGTCLVVAGSLESMVYSAVNNVQSKSIQGVSLSSPPMFIFYAGLILFLGYVLIGTGNKSSRRGTVVKFRR